MKKVKKWGNKSRNEAEPKEEAKQRQPPVEAVVATRKRRIKLYSRSRVEFASKVYGDCTAKEAGMNLAHDIGQRGLLRGKKSKSRFVSNRRGFTSDQLTELLEELVFGPPLIPPTFDSFQNVGGGIERKRKW